MKAILCRSNFTIILLDNFRVVFYLSFVIFTTFSPAYGGLQVIELKSKSFGREVIDFTTVIKYY